MSLLGRRRAQLEEGTRLPVPVHKFRAPALRLGSPPVRHSRRFRVSRHSTVHYQNSYVMEGAMLFQAAMPLLSPARQVPRSPPIAEAWDPCGVQYCRYQSRKTRTLADMSSNFQACGSVISGSAGDDHFELGGRGTRGHVRVLRPKFRNDDLGVQFEFGLLVCPSCRKVCVGLVTVTPSRGGSGPVFANQGDGPSSEEPTPKGWLPAGVCELFAAIRLVSLLCVQLDVALISAARGAVWLVM